MCLVAIVGTDAVADLRTRRQRESLHYGAVVDEIPDPPPMEGRGWGLEKVWLARDALGAVRRGRDAQAAFLAAVPRWDRVISFAIGRLAAFSAAAAGRGEVSVSDIIAALPAVLDHRIGPHERARLQANL